MRLRSKDLDNYMGRFPMWIEYHMDNLRGKLAGMEGKKRDALIKEEAAKLDRFCEVLCTSRKNHVQVEKEVYGDQKQFYAMITRKNEEHKRFLAKRAELHEQKRLQEQKTKEEEEKLRREMQEPDKSFPDRNWYKDADLTHRMREKLSAVGYKRLKTSPFGDSGAAYYWVRARYNESKEHAFFCYVIEYLLLGLADNVTLYVHSGPDIAFEHDKKEYCFDVETGKNLARHKSELERKFLRYKERYFKSFIFITNKRLKYRYSKYGTVVTRATLKKTIEALLR